MSKTIDERVVEMRFDNKQFESNVQTSLSTIEKLKKSLDMDGATKGLESITLIREGVSYNILNCLDKNTDWFTLAKGDNIFAFTADSGVTNLQFRIENKVIYEGV